MHVAASGVIQSRVVEAEETEAQINEAREEYRTPPIRGSILWFVIADLASLDPMYQYSLSYFFGLFTHCIEASAHSSNLQARLQGLMEFMTAYIYKSVSSTLN